MRRPFFMLGASLLATGALLLSQPAHAAMRGFIVTSFDSIRIEAPVRVELTTGSGVKASGEGDRDMLDRVRLSVSGGMLTIGMADGPEGLQQAVEAPTLYLSTSQLRRVTVLGGAVLRVHELTGLETDLSMNGNGEMTIEQVDIERLNLYVGGGGKMTLRGNARLLRASVNGPGALEGTGLDARDATIANDGPGSIRVTVHGPAKIVSTGSGDTIVGGAPICTVSRRGVGKVVCGP